MGSNNGNGSSNININTAHITSNNIQQQGIDTSIHTQIYITEETFIPSYTNITTGAAITGEIYGWRVTWELYWGGPTTASGSSNSNDILYKPGDELVSNSFNNYEGFLDSSANNISLANTINNPALVGTPVYLNPTANLCKVLCEGGTLSNTLNYIPEMNYMSVFHDKWSTVWQMGTATTALSIVPSIPLTYFALFLGTSGGLIGSQVYKPKNDNNVLWKD